MIINVLKSSLDQIWTWRYKSKEKKSVLKNIRSLYEWRKAVIELFDEYSLLASEAKHKSNNGEGLKILTLKQMFQRLPIVLAQVKGGNPSEILLNKIRQIIYSLYQAKVITKKVYDRIMNSIKV